MLFIGPGTPVYEGMVVGYSPKQDDIAVNVCRKKQMTNMRASGSDEALRLVPPRRMSLEECLEFLADDELLEVTPQNLRLPQAHPQQQSADEGTEPGQKRLTASNEKALVFQGFFYSPYWTMSRPAHWMSSP